ncbi:MAG TPA: hypothetical protein VH879_06855, partial [Gemmatimonadales bacterium]
MSFTGGRDSAGGREGDGGTARRLSTGAARDCLGGSSGAGAGVGAGVGGGVETDGVSGGAGDGATLDLGRSS